MDIRSFLRGLAILKGFDDQAISHIATTAKMADYSSGQILINVGDTVEAVGFLVNGQLQMDIYADTKKTLTFKENEIFNIMSLLTGEPAIATIEAVSPSRVIYIPLSVITDEMSKSPIAARQIAKLLATRLIQRSQSKQVQSAINKAQKAALEKGEPQTKKSIFVLNLGSSSIKYAVYQGKVRCLHGLVERIGKHNANLIHVTGSEKTELQLGTVDHEKALREVLTIIVSKNDGAFERLEQLYAVGHRVVHGGEKFTEATVVNAEVKNEIQRVSSLAPLHNPVNLKGIELCEKLLPQSVPQVAVFDTAFHMTMPEHAHRYAIPKELADESALRKFGFHGTSHKFVSKAASSFLEISTNHLKMITCHLGNGCSLAAIDHGRSIDTSMGLTPLEGLIMGTRCGDIDPGLLLHLLSIGFDKESLDELLNKKSGLLGLSELSRDMRDLCDAADVGHPGALLAIQTFCYRIRKYIGAYTAVLNGIDALVFTGGIGENAAEIRTRVCAGLGCLGIAIDEQANESTSRNSEIKDISAENSKVKVLVVPTDEQRMIAGETQDALERTGVSSILDARQNKPVAIGVSAHHVHLSVADVEALFGKGHRLTPIKELTQKGNFACAETVDLIGPKGTVSKVRVLGPERSQSQVEVSRTDEFKLGIDAPIRASGDLASSPGIVLGAGGKEITLNEGVICALRHIHISPEDALALGIRDKDVVRVHVAGKRSLIFGDVLVRVHPGWTLEMHLDTDEANAAEINPGMTATIESIQRRSMSPF